MANTHVNNATDLYERAKTVAWAAVAGSPSASYSLSDIIDDDHQWRTVFATAFLSVVPLQATLDGCVQALKGRDVTAEQVAAVQEPAPAGTLLTETDMATARRWLADTLAGGLDHDRRQVMIVDYVVANQWERDLSRLSSLMLAVVKTHKPFPATMATPSPSNPHPLTWPSLTSDYRLLTYQWADPPRHERRTPLSA